MDKRAIIIGGVALIVVLIFFIFVRSDGKTYNWQENYYPLSKDPYGLFIINKLLDSYTADSITTAVENDLSNLDSTATDENYVLIDRGVSYDSLEMSRLLSFVENGNSAFISTKSFPRDLALEIFPEICDGYGWTDYIFAQDSLSSLNVDHANLADSMGFDYRFIRFHQPIKYKWHYIDPDFFCAEDYSPEQLGSMDDYYPNFARKSYGDGYFYMHTTPLAFTNIQLLDEQGLAYASKVFTHLKPGRIYVDTKHGVSDALSRRMNDESDYLGDMASEGPLQFLFRHKALKWAWFLLLFTGLLFLIFRTKRRQRIIPILEANKNSSLEFISTIGSLYFLQKDNARLAHQMGQLFFGYIREHYDLPTHNLDAGFMDRLHGKSEIPKTHLTHILNSWDGLKTVDSALGSVPDKTLIEFHKNLSYFYTHCK